MEGLCCENVCTTTTTRANPTCSCGHEIPFLPKIKRIRLWRPGEQCHEREGVGPGQGGQL